MYSLLLPPSCFVSLTKSEGISVLGSFFLWLLFLCSREGRISSGYIMRNGSFGTSEYVRKKWVVVMQTLLIQTNVDLGIVKIPQLKEAQAVGEELRKPFHAK